MKNFFRNSKFQEIALYYVSLNSPKLFHFLILPILTFCILVFIFSRVDLMLPNYGTWMAYLASFSMVYLGMKISTYYFFRNFILFYYIFMTKKEKIVMLKEISSNIKKHKSSLELKLLEPIRKLDEVKLIKKDFPNGESEKIKIKIISELENLKEYFIRTEGYQTKYDDLSFWNDYYDQLVNEAYEVKRELNGLVAKFSIYNKVVDFFKVNKYVNKEC